MFFKKLKNKTLLVVLMKNLFGWFHGWIDPCEKARKNKKKLAVIQLPG
jgi:hypothetical protein